MGRLISWLCNYNAYHVPLTMANVVISCFSDHFAVCLSSQLWSWALPSPALQLDSVQRQDTWLLATFAVLCICINSSTPIALRKVSWNSANEKKIRWGLFFFFFFAVLFKMCKRLWRNQEWIKAEGSEWYFPPVCKNYLLNCFFSQHTLLDDITPITLF